MTRVLAVLLVGAILSGCSYFVDPAMVDPQAGPAHHEPMISFVFDDGARDVYENAFPILGEHPGVVYMPTGWVGRPRYLTLDQLHEMHAAGWEIASHSIDHPDLTKLSDDDVLRQLVESNEWLAEHGFNRGMSHFAVPFGAWTTREAVLADGLYDSIRPTASGYNMSPYPRLHLRSQVVLRTTSLATLYRWIDIAVESRAWLILMFHQVDNSQYLYTFEPHRFQSVVEYAASRARIVTLTEAFEREAAW